MHKKKKEKTKKQQDSRKWSCKCVSNLFQLLCLLIATNVYAQLPSPRYSKHTEQKYPIYVKDFVILSGRKVWEVFQERNWNGSKGFHKSVKLKAN